MKLQSPICPVSPVSPVLSLVMSPGPPRTTGCAELIPPLHFDIAYHQLMHCTAQIRLLVCGYVRPEAKFTSLQVPIGMAGSCRVFGVTDAAPCALLLERLNAFRYHPFDLTAHLNWGI